VQLDAEALLAGALTLRAYDASDNVVDSDTSASSSVVQTLSASSASDNITHFTIEGDAASRGVGFSNIVWGCNQLSDSAGGAACAPPLPISPRVAVHGWWMSEGSVLTAEDDRV